MDQVILPHYSNGDLLTAQEFNKLPGKINELVDAINALSSTAREYIQVMTLAQYESAPKDTRTLYLCIDNGLLSGVFIGPYSLADLEAGEGSGGALPIEQQVSDSQSMVPSSYAVFQELSKKLSVAAMESGSSPILAYDQPTNTYSVERINAILSNYLSKSDLSIITDAEIDNWFNTL